MRKKLLLMLLTFFTMGGGVQAQSDALTLTFDHDTSQTEANAEVAVNVAGVEGVSATFQQLSDYPYANGALVTNAILCPNVNRNTTPTIQYEITLTGMPTGYTFNTYAMYVHAFASQGNSYQQSLGRTWDVSVQIDGEDFVSDPVLDVCKDLVFQQTHTLRSETSKATESGTLKLLLIIKGDAGVGCFFGLESITLSNVEATPEVPVIADGKYYLKNVATGQYLAAGSDWGTHAVVNGTGLDFALALADGKYTLDSNVSNGGESHYLNGEYTDGAAFGWMFAEVGDAYTISNGTNYLTAGEDGLVTLKAETGAAAQWILETLEDRLATLATATADNGVDATFLISGANFGRNDGRNSAWTFEASNKNISGGNNVNNCAESWHSTFSISQELTNVPAGKYELTAQGFWRQDGEDNDNLPYFFANDAKTTFPERTGTENSMSEASVAFTNGLYTIDPITVIVAEDGTLTIGAKNEANLAIWCIWDNFRLTYYGEVEEPGDEIDPETAYNNALAAINDGSAYRVLVEKNNKKYYLKSDGYLTDNVEDAHDFKFTAYTVEGKAYGTGWKLAPEFTNPSLSNGSTGDIVNVGHIIVGTQKRNDWECQVFFLNNDGKFAVRSTNSTGESWGANTYWNVFEGTTLPEAGYSLKPAYVWQLQERTPEAIELDNAIKDLKDLIARGNAFAGEQGSGSLEALNAIDVNAIETLEEAKAALVTAKQAIANYIATLNITGALDITAGVLANATPVNSLDGWEGTGIGGHDNGVAEYWNVSPAGFHQTVTLPAGNYKLTAIALTRTDMHGTIYAGDNAVEIVTVGSSEVNSRAQAATWFAAGNGVNELYFTLSETTSVEIGLKADETAGDHWTVWQSFTLEKTVDNYEAYSKALASISTENYNRVFVEKDGKKYYLKADGYLTDNKDDACNFTFVPVIAAGTAYETGWNLGNKFTNPTLTGGATGDIVNDGHIHVGGNNRDDWERQVFFLNEEGKYAVRSTNATGTNWGGNTYWNVFEGETLPEAGYSLEPAYVWQLMEVTQEIVDLENALKTLKDIIANGNALAEEQGDGSIAALDEINVDAIETIDAANAAIVTAKQAIVAYIATIETLDGVDITDAVITNATPVNNLDGWEGTTIGGHDNGVAEYWNVSPAGFYQTITLPAGNYKLTAVALTRTDMHSTIYAGDNEVEIVTVGSGEVNSRAQAAAWFAAGNGVNEVYFTVGETSNITIGLKADETAGDHWTVWQSFKLEKTADPVRLAAISVYNAAVEAANTLLANEAAVGESLFQKPETAHNRLAVAVLAKTLDTNTASIEKLTAAANVLNEEIEIYKNTPVNAPEAGATYVIRQKASGLYLALSASDDQVVLSEEEQTFTWTAIRGGYYLSNEEGFVGLAGTNAWTMSALEANALVINAAPVLVDGELYYTLKEKNGIIATDDAVDGAPCYADKSIAKSGDMAYWTIEKITDAPTAIEGVIIDTEKDVIFDLNGRRVSKAQKGVYIINGKKVLK